MQFLIENSGEIVELIEKYAYRRFLDYDSLDQRKDFT